MEEALRTKAYRKDERAERRLAEINRLLEPVEAEVTAPFTEPRQPVVFIVGAPRCGSTLLAQLLAASGAFGYVNNFVARFWLAPCLGARMFEALRLGSGSAEPDYTSRFGSTPGWTGPHEFSYFWNHWFGFGETHKLSPRQAAAVDRAGLRREIAALEDTVGGPLFFKNLTCSLQVALLAEVFPRSVFAVCRRRPLYQAQSILLERREVLGDESAWISIRPAEYPELAGRSPYEQVAGQVFHIMKDVDAAVARLDAVRRVDVCYTDLCRDPAAVVAEIVRSVTALGGTVPPVRDLPAGFSPTDRQRLDDDDWAALHAACRVFFESDDLERETPCRPG